MRYEIVALFDNSSNNYMDNMLNKICRKYRLNKNFSNAYIHMGSVCDIKVDALDSVISKVLKPYKKFKVELDNNIFVNDQNRLITLKIENKGYITRIARNINETLSLSGFDIKTNAQNMDLYVPLANTSNNKKNYYLRNNNFSSIENFVAENGFKISRIEIWKNQSNKRDSLVKKYELRDY